MSSESVTRTSRRGGGFTCGLNTDLFPTKWSAFIFVSYMGLFINQGILVTATKNANNSYSYNTTSVVLITECIKLLVAAFLYNKDHKESRLLTELFKNSKVFGLYFVPALLYCLYNNLSFVNLAVFDPTTYFLMLQLRVVVTGVFFQFLFSKKLSGKQWSSLIFLTFGCILKQMPADGTLASWTKLTVPDQSYNLLLILLQVFCSCFAGVYNEYLLKNVGTDVPIMLQNVFMYIDSIACNLAVLFVQGELVRAVDPESIAPLLNWKVIAIVANNAAIGIVTSFFLHSLNSILKTFASALELMFTAVLCWIIFGIPIDRNTILAIFIVSLATYLYAQNPVVNKPKTTRDDQTSSSQEVLLLQKV